MLLEETEVGKDMMKFDRKNWRTVRFDQMAENITDRVDNPAEAGVERYVGLEHLDPESLKIMRWGTPDEVEATKLRFQSGDIIFGKRRFYQRKLAVADFEGICSAHALVLRARTDVVLKEFLPFFMQSDLFFNRAMVISVGSLSPTINWKALARQEFAIPPLDEQRRIAEVLWAADNVIYRYKHSLGCYNVWRKAFIKTIVSNLSEYVMLKDVATISYGLTVNAVRRNMPNQYSYLCVANVMRERLDLEEIKRIGGTDDDAEKFRLLYGDVLVVEGHANINEIGRAAIWRNEIKQCLHQNHLLRARCGTNLDPEYLVAYLNSKDGRAYFQKHAKSTSGLNTINSRVLSEMFIPVPSKQEQEEIVREIKMINNQAEMLAGHVDIAVKLKSHLLRVTTTC